MIEYAFVNLSSKTSYISDTNFAFRGTWAGGSTYAPPVDVVDYNNGKFIVLVQNSGTPPLNSASWSELVIRGTINPTDPFQIAQTALDTANGAAVLSLAASGTSSLALSMASQALGLAMAGTDLAQTAYSIAVNGTAVGTNTPFPQGTNLMILSGLNFGYIPSTVVCTVETPSLSGLNLFPTLVGPPTSDGFTVRLNGTTDTTGYFLNWLARR